MRENKRVEETHGVLLSWTSDSQSQYLIRLSVHNHWPPPKHLPSFLWLLSINKDGTGSEMNNRNKK